jgi:hypothetical protein
MKIHIEPHTLQRAIERGSAETEIIDVIETGTSIQGKAGRLGKTKIFPFNSMRIGKFYEEKKVDVYYIIEQENIFTVTVYVFYGKFNYDNSLR